MKKSEWRSTSNSVYVLNYHFVWSTKYRKRVLFNPVDNKLNEIILSICIANDIEILQSEIMPDHVHLFLFAKPTQSPSYLMKQIRGSSAYQLFREYPWLRRKLWKGHLWNPSYYVGTAGQMSADTIKQYILNQKTK